MDYKGYKDIHIDEFDNRLYIGDKCILTIEPSTKSKIIAGIILTVAFLWFVLPFFRIISHPRYRCIFCNKLCGLFSKYHIIEKYIYDDKEDYEQMCSDCHGKLRLLSEKRETPMNTLIERLERRMSWVKKNNNKKK